MSDPILFTLAVLALLAAPGPTNTLLAAAGASAGWRGSLRLIPAEIAGYLIAVLTLHAMLAEAMDTWPSARLAMRAGICLFLIWTAWRLWRSGCEGVAAPVLGPGRIFITTLFNPKAFVFAFGVLPLSHPSAPAYLAGFAALITIVASAWIAVGAIVAGASPGLGRHANRVAAVAVAGFAALIASG